MAKARLTMTPTPTWSREHGRHFVGEKFVINNHLTWLLRRIRVGVVKVVRTMGDIMGPALSFGRNRDFRIRMH